jgi:hypothetical protein
VVRGIEDDRAFATVDVGKTRSHGDIFSIAGFKSVNEVSGAALIIRYYKLNQLNISGPKGKEKSFKGPDGKRISAGGRKQLVDKKTLLEFALPHKDKLEECVIYTQRLYNKRRGGSGKVIPISIMAACYFLFQEKDADSAKRFLDDLSEGAGLESNDPVYTLRERMIANNMALSKMTRWAVLYLAFLAWNKRRRGEKTKVLKIMDGAEFLRLI